MADKNETNDIPPKEIFSTIDEDQKTTNVDPNDNEAKPDELLDASDDTTTEEFSSEETEEGETDDNISGAITASTIVRRGSKFRKKLLTRISGVNYREFLDSETLDLKSWLSSVMDLKAQDFLAPLEQIVSKRDK